MGKPRYWGGSGRATLSTRTPKNGADDETLAHDEPSSTSAGCMCAVFQLFDFHPLNQHHHPPQSPVSLKPVSLPPDDHISTGTEAPRNSLESDEELPLSCTAKQKEDGLHIPKGVVQIKTRSRSNESSINEGGNSSDYFSGNSPRIKTPTLVARLMGLDLLPQTNSPVTTPRTASASPSYALLQKPKSRHCLVQNDHLIGSRSLPETPRTSCERKSNVDNYHHRLSLQIPNYDKENASPSPSHYAKEIVKQIKETVIRRAGLDITNYTRRDEVIIQTKPKKVLSSPATSPRLRVLEPKNFNKPSPKVETSKSSGKPKQKAKTKPLSVQILTDSGPKEIKKEINETFGRPARITKKANKQEEPFVIPSRITKATNDSPRKKSKKTPLSNDLLSFSSVPTVLMKKDPSISSAISPQMQSQCNGNQSAETGEKESKRFLQLSSFQNQPHKRMHGEDVIQQKKDGNKKHHIREAAASAAISTTASDCSNNHDITAELEYVREILSRTSSPVYSVFLEDKSEVSTCHPSDRKLLCHLVEELVKPYLEMRPWVAGGCRQLWAEVVEKLCEKVRRYPRAKCEVLEDIDGIIEKDMERLGMGSWEEEGEGIVKEIEEWLVEELVKEAVSFRETEMAEESRGGVGPKEVLELHVDFDREDKD